MDGQTPVILARGADVHEAVFLGWPRPATVDPLGTIKIEGRPSFSPKEMDGWFTMCGFQKPAQISLALFDAKRKYGYTESAARGIWRISNQGENLIIRKVEEARESR